MHEICRGWLQFGQQLRPLGVTVCPSEKSGERTAHLEAIGDREVLQGGFGIIGTEIAAVTLIVMMVRCSLPMHHDIFSRRGRVAEDADVGKAHLRGHLKRVAENAEHHEKGCNPVVHRG